MPVTESGVRLVEESVPKGKGNASPPAKACPPWAVWHTRQSAAAARYSPRLTGDSPASAAGTPVGSLPGYWARATFGPLENPVGPGPPCSQKPAITIRDIQIRNTG